MPAGAISLHPHERAAGDHADCAQAGSSQERPQGVFGTVRAATIKVSDDPDLTTGPHIGERFEMTVTGMQLGLAPAWALGSAGATRTFPVLAGIEALTIFAKTADAIANVRAVREYASGWIGREVADPSPKAGDELNDALTA